MASEKSPLAPQKNKKKLENHENVPFLNADATAIAQGDIRSNDDGKNALKINPRYKSFAMVYLVLSLTLFPILIIIISFIDFDSSFSFAFALGISSCIFGICYLTPFIKLTEELVEVYAENQKHRLYTDDQHRLVKILGSKKQDFMEQNERMKCSNKETQKMVAAFQMMDISSLDELNETRDKATKVYKKWADGLLKKERCLLSNLFDRYELMDNEDGMSKQEYDQFLNHLPDGYRQRMERLGAFNHLSEGKDVVDFHDFKAALDVFAEMQLNDVDIHFDIQKCQEHAKNDDDDGKDNDGGGVVSRASLVKRAIIKKKSVATRKIKNKLFQQDT